VKKIILGMAFFAATACQADVYQFVLDKPKPVAVQKPESIVAITQTEPQPAPWTLRDRVRVDVSSFYNNIQDDNEASGRATRIGVLLGADAMLIDRVHALGFVGVDQKSKFSGILEGEYALLKKTFWKSAHLFQAGPLLGLNTFRSVDGAPVTMHLGARASAAINEKLEATAAVRGNLGFILGELGVGLHL
jgi:hypothetical protein